MYFEELFPRNSLSIKQKVIFTLCVFLIYASNSVYSAGPKIWVCGHHLELDGFVPSHRDWDDVLSFVKGDVSSLISLFIPRVTVRFEGKFKIIPSSLFLFKT